MGTEAGSVCNEVILFKRSTLNPYISALDTMWLSLSLQAAQVNTIAGQQDSGCTTTDGTNSGAAPFPGGKAAHGHGHRPRLGIND